MAGDPKEETWLFTVRFIPASTDTTANPAPPTLEIMLRVEGVPAGAAWEITPDRALPLPEIVRAAALTADEQARIRASAAWSRIFLVSPASFEPSQRPIPTPVPDLNRVAVPVAFGLRALAEATTLLGPGRAFAPVTLTQLIARLTPDQPSAFPGAHEWFPEPPATQREFAGLDVQTGVHANELVVISHPVPGRPFDAVRVLPDSNEWVIAAGPFRLMPMPVAQVTSAHGRTKDYTREQLLTELAGKPRELAVYLANMDELEGRLQAALNRVVLSGPGRTMHQSRYFWAPAMRDFHAEALRTLEKERFTAAVAASLDAEKITYRATFRPASATGKVGFTYNPEHRAGLEGSLTSSGLLHPEDALSASATSAERAITGALNYRIPYDRSPDRKTTYQLEIFASSGRDENFRLGGLSAAPFEHRFQNGGVEHQFKREWERWTLTLRHAVVWAAHTIDQTGTFGHLRENGLLLRQRQSWTTTAQSAPDGVRWELAIEPGVSYGPPVGWRQDFWQAELVARTKAWWGGSKIMPAPMYVAAQTSAADGSAATPAALLYRLGDTDRLFGLETGEFSGRSYLHGELAYGVRLSHLLRALFKTNGKIDPTAAPPMLQGIFARAFGQAGRVGSGGSTLFSYGLALETGSSDAAGGAGFQIGYAWSPQSRLSNGRMFSALNWNF